MIKHLFVTLLLCALCVLCGCNSNPLRFAPTEAQKQNAALAVETTRLIRDNGADAGAGVTEVAHQATVNTQAYFGLPVEPMAAAGDILQTAATDAARRPAFSDVMEQADAGLSLAEQLAALFGVGGLVLFGKSLLSWIVLLRSKAAGFEQTIAGNELLKDYFNIKKDTAAMDAFKQFQNIAQDRATRELVAVTRVNGIGLPSVGIIPPMPAVQAPAV